MIWTLVPIRRGQGGDADAGVQARRRERVPHVVDPAVLAPAAWSAGTHSRERKSSMSIRPPSAVGKRMPRRAGNSASAKTTLARSGTVAVAAPSLTRRERAVGERGRTVKLAASRSTSLQPAPALLMGCYAAADGNVRSKRAVAWRRRLR
jgi:hypothetical protein